MNRLENLFYVRMRAGRRGHPLWVGRRGHPLWEEPAGVIASRILDEGYDEITELQPVGARPGFNNGWPRLPWPRLPMDGTGYRWMAPVTDGWHRLPWMAPVTDSPGYRASPERRRTAS